MGYTLNTDRNEGPRFSLGKIVATPGIFDAFKDKTQQLMVECLRRHHYGDWGELCKDDKKANESALKSGARILSSYIVEGTKVYVITEADRSTTTILLPSEY